MGSLNGCPHRSHWETAGRRAPPRLLRWRIVASSPQALLELRRGALLTFDPEPVHAKYVGKHLAAPRLVTYWATGSDWRRHEQRIRALPWVLTGAGGGPPVRVVQRRAADAAAPVVLLLHGWPDSVLRFERLLPLLEDVHVVIPALPGFPFAAPVTRGGLSAAALAEAVAAAMAELGYDRCTSSAGDVGCDVAEALARAHPDRVSALHLTDVSQNHFLHHLPIDLTADEQAYVAQGRQWQAAEGGYLHEQSTKPSTLAVGLGDSPAGWRRGSWRSCAAGPTATATSRPSSAATSCSPGSPPPGSAGRSAPPSPRTPKRVALHHLVVESFRLRCSRCSRAWEQPRAYATGVHALTVLPGWSLLLALPPLRRGVRRSPARRRRSAPVPARHGVHRRQLRPRHRAQRRRHDGGARG